jgi:hypothetical protein
LWIVSGVTTATEACVVSPIRRHTQVSEAPNDLATPAMERGRTALRKALRGSNSAAAS